MDASSRARYSVSDCVRRAVSRSSSTCWRSRSSWRPWASRISGAAYAACVEKARFNRMNGNVSKWTWRVNAKELNTIQTATRKVWTMR